jgi:hypothetical protein
MMSQRTEIVVRNAGTVEQALQSGAEITVRMSEYSAANINAIVKSNVKLVEPARASHFLRDSAISSPFNCSMPMNRFRAALTRMSSSVPKLVL